MKNEAIFAVILVVAALIGIDILRRIFAKRYTQKMTQMLFQEEYDEFDHIMNRKRTRYLVPPFELDHLKLTAYLIQDKQSQINEHFECTGR